MRKRELQSITLKLSELKEYDNVKMERAMARKKAKAAAEEAKKDEGPEPEPPTEFEADILPIASVAAKSKQEVLERMCSTN